MSGGRDDRVVTLPEQGRAIICSDLHGQWFDFCALLERSRFEERLEAGEELWLIITGDVPDTFRHRVFDPQVPIDGDAQILDRLIELSDRYPGRVLYLEGNHDFHLARITQEVEEYCQERGLGSARRDGVLSRELLGDFLGHYRSQYGMLLYRNNIEPYDMLTRLTGAQLDFVGGGPVLAYLPGARLLVTHAGPPRRDTYAEPEELRQRVRGLERDQLRGLDPEQYYSSAYHQMLNNRYGNGDYDLGDIEAFCQVYDAGALVTGHTPLTYLVGSGDDGACRIENHLGWVGRRQAVLCTSFGALTRETKVFLEVDLARPLEDVSSLRPGEEVQTLYESHAATKPGARAP